MSRRRTQCGAVTAETALALPLVVVFTVAMAWLVSLGVTQVRVLDAARETARAAARSEDRAQATSWGRRVAPEGSTISVRRADGAVVVRVSSQVAGPGGIFGRWARVDVAAEAVAAEEPSW